MRLIRGRRAWVESVSLVALLFSALACNGDKPIGTERPALYPLPKEGDIIDLGDFDDFLRGHVKGDTHERDRDASGCKKCVKVEIQSIGLTTDIKEDQGPAEDRVVARLENKHEKNKTTMYGIQPKAKADYYMWVHGGGGATRWTIVEFEKQGGGKAKAHPGATGTFRVCENHDPLKSDADFQSCARAHPAAVNKSSLWTALPEFFRSSLEKLFQDTASMPPGEDPAWLRCANGCCTAAT